MKEAHRLSPPAHPVLRHAEAGVTLRRYRIPAGSQVSLPTYFVHRDGRWWEEPGAFRPDRWTEDPEPEYSYFPFGGGPRACIGSRVAMMELRLALATMARRVRVDLPADQPAEPALRTSVTLQPDEPIELTVRER